MGRLAPLVAGGNLSAICTDRGAAVAIAASLLMWRLIADKARSHQ